MEVSWSFRIIQVLFEVTAVWSLTTGLELRAGSYFISSIKNTNGSWVSALIPKEHYSQLICWCFLCSGWICRVCVFDWMWWERKVGCHTSMTFFINSIQKLKFFIIYSPSCLSKPVWFSFFLQNTNESMQKIISSSVLSYFQYKYLNI